MKALYTVVATAGDRGRGRPLGGIRSRPRQEAAQELVARAHERCSYSNATRGNIPVDLTVAAR